jgi:outer membrane protein assembly factor BamB
VPSRQGRWLRVVLAALVAVAAAGGLELAFGTTLDEPSTVARPDAPAKPAPRPTDQERPAERAAPPVLPQGAINPDVPGITTFRGNLTRSYYGEGPVPSKPRILWRFPRSGGMCSPSTDETGTHTWCGVGWTGQPNVIPGKRGRLELRFGAYDSNYHFLRARTGRRLRADLVTGDLAKGSATSDPDGYPLYYAGSRDDQFRIVALDRGRPTVLWSLDANTSAPDPTWNNDWDGAALVVGDYLIEGGENSWLHVIRLNRRYDRRGKVRVRPKVVLTLPSWDAQLEVDAPDRHYSIENSVAFDDGVVYFANSAGLVEGWNISRVLRGGHRARRVFRFWTGDDTDASIVIDEEGALYVASELEKMNARSAEVGQLIKLDPSRRRRPLLWSVPIREAADGAGGSWSTPALDRELVYVATNAGGLLAVERDSGRVRWRIGLPGPTWSSPVVVDNVLLQGDCDGVMHAYDVSDQTRRPPQLWRVELGGCIEATPAVWKGMVFVGTRAGAMYALGERG